MREFKDLVYRIEGYEEIPAYDIESITRFKGGRIGIVIRERQPEEAASAEAQDGGQTGGEDESN